MNRFPRFKLKSLAQCINVNKLFFQTDQITFHGPCKYIIASMMAKFFQIKITAQIPINPPEKIQIKFPGNALGIVICPAHQIDIFFQIEASH